MINLQEIISKSSFALHNETGWAQCRFIFCSFSSVNWTECKGLWVTGGHEGHTWPVLQMKHVTWRLSLRSLMSCWGDQTHLTYNWCCETFSEMNSKHRQISRCYCWAAPVVLSRRLSRRAKFTRCIIRNCPFKWKTGMSYRYLSNQTLFSGRVMSTSCSSNWHSRRTVNTRDQIDRRSASGRTYPVFVRLQSFFCFVAQRARILKTARAKTHEQLFQTFMNFCLRIFTNGSVTPLVPTGICLPDIFELWQRCSSHFLLPVVFKPVHEVTPALHILHVSLCLTHSLQLLQSPLMSWIRCDGWGRRTKCAGLRYSRTGLTTTALCLLWFIVFTGC